MALALVRCSIEADQGRTPHARARVSLVSWEGRSHVVLRVRGPWPKRYSYHFVLYNYILNSFVLYVDCSIMSSGNTPVLQLIWVKLESG